MDLDEFIVLVNKQFGFLIETYGFSIVYSKEYGSFGDCSVILENDDCRIRIMMDRGQVLIDVGYKDAPNYYTSPKQWRNGSTARWYGLPVIISFLEKVDFLKWEYVLPESGFDEKTRVENQIRRLSDLSKPYWGEIICLFQKTIFKKNQKKLDEFIDKLTSKD